MESIDPLCLLCGGRERKMLHHRRSRVGVPNHEGTDARRMGNFWPQWDLPYHLYHFTPRTLLALLERHGFHPLAAKSYHSETIKERLRKIPGLAPLARPIAKFFSGHSFAVVARKT